MKPEVTSLYQHELPVNNLKLERNSEWHWLDDWLKRKAVNTEEIKDRSTTLITNKEDLTNDLQGYIKASTKLIRSIVSHHLQLLTTAIEKQKPPRD